MPAQLSTPPPPSCRHTRAIKCLSGWDNEHYRFNCFEGGGCIVYRIYDTFFLFELPRYEGKGMFIGSFSINEIDRLLETANSLT